MWLFFNQVAFWHYHILDNGIVVEHAHPFKNSPKQGTPYQSHQHSDFEYTILAQVSNITTLLLIGIVLGLLFKFTTHPKNYARVAATVTSEYLSIERLRGPPVSF